MKKILLSIFLSTIFMANVVAMAGKYSLQGTTQGRYLTGETVRKL